MTTLEPRFQGGKLFLLQGYRTIAEAGTFATQADAPFVPPFLCHDRESEEEIARASEQWVAEL